MITRKIKAYYTLFIVLFVFSFLGLVYGLFSGKHEVYYDSLYFLIPVIVLIGVVLFGLKRKRKISYYSAIAVLGLLLLEPIRGLFSLDFGISTIVLIVYVSIVVYLILDLVKQI